MSHGRSNVVLGIKVTASADSCRLMWLEVDRFEALISCFVFAKKSTRPHTYHATSYVGTSVKRELFLTEKILPIFKEYILDITIKAGSVSFWTPATLKLSEHPRSLSLCWRKWGFIIFLVTKRFMKIVRLF